jgi:hypothetical protein
MGVSNPSGAALPTFSRSLGRSLGIAGLAADALHEGEAGKPARKAALLNRGGASPLAAWGVPEAAAGRDNSSVILDGSRTALAARPPACRSHLRVGTLNSNDLRGL